MDDRDRGLYEKFIVARTDGRDQPGEKHDGCEHFVLDLDHDPHALPAIAAYAESCLRDGYEALAEDLIRKIKAHGWVYHYTDSYGEQVWVLCASDDSRSKRVEKLVHRTLGDLEDRDWEIAECEPLDLRAPVSSTYRSTERDKSFLMEMAECLAGRWTGGPPFVLRTTIGF